jgi:PE-PPE domain
VSTDPTGKTSYYFFETRDLPLFGPLRTLGVPEPVIDVVEPFFRVIVELGYDRNIRPWEPTPARLIPTLDPGKVATDLVNAIGEGINNAPAIIGLPPLLRIPAPAATEPDQDAAIEQVLSGPGTPKTISRDVSDDVSQVLTAVGSELPEPPAVTQDDLEASQRKVVREPAATRDEVDETIGAIKSVIGNGRAIVRSTGTSNGYNAVTASPARKTPVRDAVKNASGDIKKVVTKVSDSMKTALRGGKEDDDNADGVTAKRSKSAESEQP